MNHDWTYAGVMDRRRFLLSAGAAVPVVALAGCRRSGAASDPAPFREDGIFFDAAALSLIDILSDIMIPETDTPGARATDAAGFADGMMAGWAREETRRNVVAAVEWLNDQARERFGRGFAGLAPDRQILLAERLDTGAFSGAGLPDAVSSGYRSLKQVIYSGYYLSETGATLELQYEPVPGAFRGCVPLEDVARK